MKYQHAIITSSIVMTEDGPINAAVTAVRDPELVITIRPIGYPVTITITEDDLREVQHLLGEER